VSTPQGESARFIAEAMKSHGLTQKQVGSFLGVSDRMVRHVLSGAKPGANLTAGAKQLAQEGRVTSAPARREQRVRSKGGGTRKVLQPAEQRHTVESGGRSQSAVAVPKRGPGKDSARDAITTALEARRGGEKGTGGQRVTFTMTTRDGKTITLGKRGGYDPKSVARQIEDDAGGDPLKWLSNQTKAASDGQAREDGDTDVYGVSAGDIAVVSMSFV
jgi:hypothetical protein